ncbi:hypothetical protein HPB51_021794 [Rhipicephalus microplus]|uniref:ARMC9 CTLH-like domain-containing protein n=1 Tax=Rhipicephalus microplus TaxID=6941 RepID=A0A9J6DCE4_RHIMP|nr:hypothetical protein HPB51_021794 [Rhipicephalus microplus]
MDLVGLRDTWSHLDSHIFRRLEQSFIPTVRKLEMALLRMYVVTCVTNSRQDKLTEFFDKMALELHFQAEWKEWFALPFLKCVEDNPNFQVYFTRQWQEMMIISLRNFLSVVYQSMALPTLLSYDEDMNRMQFLQEENESLKHQLAAGRSEVCETADVLVAPEEPMDDFYVIAQVWSSNPSPRTLATVVSSKSSVTALEWVHKHDHLASGDYVQLVYGLKQGNLRLYDTKERRTLFDIVPESASVLKEHRVYAGTIRISTGQHGNDGLPMSTQWTKSTNG